MKARFLILLFTRIGDHPFYIYYNIHCAVPQDEIDIFKEKIDERGMSEMLAIENYSVQDIKILL